MRKLLCFIGLHDWLYNSIDIEIGTERVCQRCDIKEVFVRDSFTGNHFWYRIR